MHLVYLVTEVEEDWEQSQPLTGGLDSGHKNLTSSFY